MADKKNKINVVIECKELSSFKSPYLQRISPIVRGSENVVYIDPSYFFIEFSINPKLLGESQGDERPVWKFVKDLIKKNNPVSEIGIELEDYTADNPMMFISDISYSFLPVEGQPELLSFEIHIPYERNLYENLFWGGKLDFIKPLNTVHLVAGYKLFEQDKQIVLDKKFVISGIPEVNFSLSENVGLTFRFNAIGFDTAGPLTLTNFTGKSASNFQIEPPDLGSDKGTVGELLSSWLGENFADIFGDTLRKITISLVVPDSISSKIKDYLGRNVGELKKLSFSVGGDSGGSKGKGQSGNKQSSEGKEQKIFGKNLLAEVFTSHRPAGGVENLVLYLKDVFMKLFNTIEAMDNKEVKNIPDRYVVIGETITKNSKNESEIVYIIARKSDKKSNEENINPLFIPDVSGLDTVIAFGIRDEYIVRLEQGNKKGIVFPIIDIQAEETYRDLWYIFLTNIVSSSASTDYTGVGLYRVTLTTVFLPFISLFDPVYIAPEIPLLGDAYYIVLGIQHDFSQLTTTLTLMLTNSKFFAKLNKKASGK